VRVREKHWRLCKKNEPVAFEWPIRLMASGMGLQIGKLQIGIGKGEGGVKAWGIIT
jgi:hypothetical protein